MFLAYTDCRQALQLLPSKDISTLQTHIDLGVDLDLKFFQLFSPKPGPNSVFCFLDKGYIGSNHLFAKTYLGLFRV